MDSSSIRDRWNHPWVGVPILGWRPTQILAPRRSQPFVDFCSRKHISICNVVLGKRGAGEAVVGSGRV